MWLEELNVVLDCKAWTSSLLLIKDMTPYVQQHVDISSDLTRLYNLCTCLHVIDVSKVTVFQCSL